MHVSGRGIGTGGKTGRSAAMRAIAAIVVGMAMAAALVSPASADDGRDPRRSTVNQGGNQPTPSGSKMVEPQAEAVPAGCPTAPPDSSGYTDEPWYQWSWTDDQSINELCADAVRLAPTWVAQKAIKYAFSKLGTPYSQDSTLRTTRYFDCSSFVGRAFTAAGAYMYQNGVYQNRTFFNMFGWTGAYTKYAPYAGFPAPGYHDSNLIRVERKDLLPGDIIIKFNGTSGPANSAGNAGHAQIYLGGGKIIESSDRVAVDYVSPSTSAARAGYLSNEWYYRWAPAMQRSTWLAELVAPDRKDVPAFTQRTIPVASPGQSVVGNFTVVGATTPGWATVWPCDRPRPLASNVQYGAQAATPVLAVSPTDAAGNICVVTSTDAHVIWDNTYAGADISGHQPDRLVDTRVGLGGATRVGPGSTTAFEVAGAGKTVMATLTAVKPATNGHLRVFTCGQNLPPASTLNFREGVNTANLAVATADGQGRVCVYSTSETDLLWDQVVEADLATHAPTRQYDSRLPSNAWPVPGNNNDRIAPGREIKLHVAEPLQTVIGNLTITDPLNPGHGVVYPCTPIPQGAATAKPDTSAINFVGGQTVANAVIVRADANGDICYQGNEWTHVIWDQVAEVARPQAGKASRAIDTRLPGIYPYDWVYKFPMTGGPSTF